MQWQPIVHQNRDEKTHVHLQKKKQKQYVTKAKHNTSKPKSKAKRIIQAKSSLRIAGFPGNSGFGAYDELEHVNDKVEVKHDDRLVFPPTVEEVHVVQDEGILEDRSEEGREEEGIFKGKQHHYRQPVASHMTHTPNHHHHIDRQQQYLQARQPGINTQFVPRRLPNLPTKEEQ